jgi:hypothetical protein
MEIRKLERPDKIPDPSKRPPKPKKQEKKKRKLNIPLKPVLEKSQRRILYVVLFLFLCSLTYALVSLSPMFSSYPKIADARPSDLQANFFLMCTKIEQYQDSHGEYPVSLGKLPGSLRYSRKEGGSFILEFRRGDLQLRYDSSSLQDRRKLAEEQSGGPAVSGDGK